MHKNRDNIYINLYMYRFIHIPIYELAQISQFSKKSKTPKGVIQKVMIFIQFFKKRQKRQRYLQNGWIAY